jgi:thymidylate synthase (FAD)
MGEVKPEVRLVRYTPEPENLVAEMARACYADNEKIARLFQGPIDSVSDGEMIKRLAKMKHLSPFEHASWSFFITGVSRAMTHQLVRHRLLAVSQRSQRYVTQTDFNYIIPESVRVAGLEESFKQMMMDTGRFYKQLSEGLEKKGFKGEDRNQDARYVLPNACETTIGITGNGRELLHIFQERLCNRAQWEIRYVASEMLRLVRPTAPAIFELAGPSCYVEGKCYQGRKTCGKMAEVIKEYERLGGEIK